MSDLLTTDEAGVRLGVSAQRVRQFIESGRLPAERYGDIWLIRPADLACVGERKPGRPRGQARQTAAQG
jgi:excisionase family DNA binding protein